MNTPHFDKQTKEALGMPLPKPKVVRCESVIHLKHTGDGGGTRGLKYAEQVVLVDPAPQDEASRLLPGLHGQITLTFRDASEWGGFTPGVWYKVNFTEANPSAKE